MRFACDHSPGPSEIARARRPRANIGVWLATLLVWLCPRLTKAQPWQKALRSRCAFEHCAPSRYIAPAETASRLKQVAPGLQVTTVSSSFAVVQPLPAALVADEPLSVGVPLELFMDRAAVQVGLPEALDRGAGTGSGVVLAIVDTGIDAAHAAFLTQDGRSRVAWWLDFLTPPLGLHPGIEADLGCVDEPGLRCAVLSGEDIQRKLQDPDAHSFDLPSDAVGHGTHIASLAAGSESPTEPAGVAPESSIVAVRVADPRMSLVDANVLLAARFVFDRAAELGQPAVLNLSLGGDFGPHDGSSDLAQALAEMVGDGGRAIVVAAGNGGELVSSSTDPAQTFGRHAELEVAGHFELPVQVPAHGAAEVVSGSILTWFNVSPPDSVAVGLIGPEGVDLPAVAESARSAVTEDLGVAILQGTGLSPSAAIRGELAESEPSASFSSVVGLIDGAWSPEETFRWQLEGTGRVDVWVQSQGAIRSISGGVGALLPYATERQTVAIPAVHPALIAVGASLNRVEWIDRRGNRQGVPTIVGMPALAVGAPASFSAGGPNALGGIKPDLLAPGAFVAGALSAAADPASSRWSGFEGSLLCTPATDCLITEHGRGVTQGTSMAAPLVAGAVALALERDPQLTQSELLGRLRAGAVASAGTDLVRSGVGQLNIVRTMLLEDADTTSGVSAELSRWVVGRHPLIARPAQRVQIGVQLSTQSGAPFDVPLERLELRARGVNVVEPLRRAGPGWFEAWVAPADARAGAARLTLLVDGEAATSHLLQIGDDVEGVAEDDGCICGVPSGGTSPGAYAGWMWVGALLLARRRCAQL